MPRITSFDNPRLRSAARLLASSRERRKAGLCVLEGDHLIGVYCAQYGPPETLIVAETAMVSPAMLPILARVPGAQTLVVTDAVWTGFASLPAGVGSIAVVQVPEPVFVRTAAFCLLLEDVQDPGNVGSILRSAAAAGVTQAFLSPHCAFAWSPKVLRAGQGAHFHLEIYEDVDLIEWARTFRGTMVATVPQGGESVFSAELTRPLALAIGNEGAGLSAELCTLAAHRVTIPMPGGFESLNAAAAAAVCLFEAVRRDAKA
jgi:TrmH family RNA methyltransferase